MFLPNAAALDEKKIAENRRKEAFRNIEKWSLEFVPESMRDDAVVSSQEMVCGDPECSPIDTIISIVFQSGMDGSIGVPCIAADVTKEELKERFPTEDVLEKWHKGEFAEWPPINHELPTLRFDVGTRVSCRIGPNAETDWTPGTIVQLWYSEESWPEGSYAPYKIKLDDGRQIFAPGDIDQVIRRLES